MLYNQVMSLLAEIREKFANNTFEFSKHAVDQTILRDITVDEIRHMSQTHPNGKISESGDNAMTDSLPNEKLVERRVTYTLVKDGQLIVVDNVPARVNEETGEQFFSPQTVEKLQRILRQKQRPVRFIQTPVYDFT
jgi:YgiT-type zinc finger domain-containing protein